MEPVRYNITLYQNASWLLETTFRDPEGDPIDLSAHAAELIIRRTVPSEETLLHLTSENSEILLSGSVENNLIVRISRTQTRELPTQNREIEDWVYDLKLWEDADPEYTTVRLMQGEVFVSPAVTREG